MQCCMQVTTLTLSNVITLQLSERESALSPQIIRRAIFEFHFILFKFCLIVYRYFRNSTIVKCEINKSAIKKMFFKQIFFSHFFLPTSARIS